MNKYSVRKESVKKIMLMTNTSDMAFIEDVFNINDA